MNASRQLSALDALPLASALLDAGLRIVCVNDRFTDLVGGADATPVGTRFVEHLVDEDPDDDEDPGQALAARLKALADGQALAQELVLRDALHETARLRGHFARLPDGAPGFGGVQADYLVQLEPAVDALAGQSATVSQPLAWYRMLFLESVLPKLLLDERFRIVDVNDAALELLEYELPDLLWRDPADLLDDDVSRERLARERDRGELSGDPIREARAYPVRFGDGRVARVDAVVVRSSDDASRALRVMTLLSHLDEPGSEEDARWHERFLAAIRDEQRMLPTLSIGAALLQDGQVTRMTASFAHFFELDAGESVALDRVVGRKTASAIEESASLLDEDARDPYQSLPVTEFVWSSTSGRPSSFVAMARPAGAEGAVLLTLVDTSGRDADIASRLERLALSRDALLRQVHHQVSNNLTGLAELIRAEAQWNPQAKDLLERVTSRLLVAGHIEGLQPRDYAKATQPIAELVGGIAQSLARHFGAEVAVSGPDPEAPRRWIVRNERLALALACNELITNAIKHREVADEPVKVIVDVGEREVTVTVRNSGTLGTPPTDDAGRPAPQGVALMRRLLPAQGADFELSQEGTEVVGRIRLSAPAIY